MHKKKKKKTRLQHIYSINLVYFLANWYLNNDGRKALDHL